MSTVGGVAGIFFGKLYGKMKKGFPVMMFAAAAAGTAALAMPIGALAICISHIIIERASDRVKVTVHTAKPGMVIGKGGADIEKLKADVQKMTSKKLLIDVKEIKRPDRDAQLVAENIAQQLENRVSFRRAMKSAMSRTMKSGALGIKTCASGRLGGADIARSEHYHEGSIPLQTLRANIDYGFAEAKTTYGRLGIKVWIYKGQILPRAKKAPAGKEGK